MSNTGPFDVSNDEGTYTLLIDGSWLDHAEPISVRSNGDVLALGDDVDVRGTFTTDEALKLWRLLDGTIGEWWREGQAVKAEMDALRARGFDTRPRSRDEYNEAVRVVADVTGPAVGSEAFVDAIETITVYRAMTGTEL